MEDRTTTLDHFYLFGDVYETLDTCEQLQAMLARLHRQDLLSGEDLQRSKQNLAMIRGRVESYLNSSNLMPKGPSLP